MLDLFWITSPPISFIVAMKSKLLCINYLRSLLICQFLHVSALSLLVNANSSRSYRKILTQILIHLDPRSVDRIKCILGWVAFSKRPLKKLEFLSAISFSAGNPEVAHLAPQYILDICGPLIEERRDSTLAFIHVSVKE